MRMKAAVMTGVGAVAIDEVDIAGPKAGEVLVRIVASGVCHSDLHALMDASTPVPCILGHEGAGTVEAVGAGVTALAPGDRVALNWLPYCERCRACARGQVHLCDTVFGPMFDGTLLDGTSRLSSRGKPVSHYSLLSTFAELAVVAETSCSKLPEGMPLAQAALLGCGVATGYGAAVRAGGVRAGDTVAVFGCGGVGANAVQGARIAGAERIVAVDVKAVNLEAARTFGATHTIDAGAQDVVAILKDLTQGHGVDVAIEASGSTRACLTAWNATRRGGTVVVVGAFSGETLELPAPGFHRQGKVLRGSFYGDVDPRREIPALAALYLEGRLRLDELVTRRIPLARIGEAFEAFHDRTASNAGRWVIE